ncbi:YAP-binding/ALF4/Glomulin [Cercophora newfieldiana]|uniref:YAP-binding/ALF4/Glomulin n=1 Tax=Cercophora newfieldiana TaxID=92897 RepID=A0AA40CR32_9PEZI|nr:YAP-binding/ALF4/Glomulin [Cercophora newfieldiana]
MATELPSVDSEKAIAAIRDARPPVTDRFTYLTIIEANLSPAVLPALDEILQDAELTQEIGWDLVFNLVNLPGSETCLETIARLGNPREVILKVLETLELLDTATPQGDDEDAPTTVLPQVVMKEKKFVTLLGMLAILHHRIKTKYPSRFLAQTLRTVFHTYTPTPEATAAVVNLVHNLSGRQRPALPSRKSSINVANPDQDGDASKNAPDPEAEVKDNKEDPSEVAMQRKLLLSFAVCVLETYTNQNDMAWAARLLEFYNPERVVPGRRTLMASFREDQQLLERDDNVGRLVALIKDLGLDSYSKQLLAEISENAPIKDPLAATDDAAGPNDVALPTGGCIALIAYWVFSTTIFDADQPTPDMNILPEHFALLEKVLEDDAEGQIRSSPGTSEALVAIGLWLHANNHISAAPYNPEINPSGSEDEPTSEFMQYVHLLTLVALYHPRLHVRNSATMLAGHIFHANPSEDDKLRILYDLIENCTFASLKACAITWLREEIIDASKTPSPGAGTASSAPAPGGSTFSTPQPLDTLQYVIFPNMNVVSSMEAFELLDFLRQNVPFLLQAVNFGLFLWSSSKWKHVLPANADATVKERWFRPLSEAVDAIRTAMRGSLKNEDEVEEARSLLGDLDVLGERMMALADAEGFKAAEEADRA